MKKTAFVSTYYNNAHFIELQSKCLYKNILDSYDFIVLDDSEDDTKSLLTNKNSNQEIIEECEKHGARHIRVPQSIHAYERDGGYVPNHNASTNHPTERHQAVLRWLFKNYKSLGLNNYEYLALTDADVFIKKPLKMEDYMEYDIVGTGRTQTIDLPLGKFPDNMFSSKVKTLNGKTIYFFTFFIMFFNLKTVKNLSEIDVGSFPATDTGSQSHFFIQENKQYTFHFLSERHDSDVRIDVASKNSSFDADSAELLHYRAGSNWSYESSDYYKAKLNLMLKKYLPDFTDDQSSISFPVKSRDGVHIIK
jgi:hypothetical protein